MKLDPLINRFRLASRELYNNHFSIEPPEDFDAWDWCENFYDVERALFRALVIHPSPLSKAEYGARNQQIRVVSQTDTTPILINRLDDRQHGYWDCPINQIDRTAVLQFVYFFDFDRSKPKDNQYAMVWIESFPGHEIVSGRYALIEHQYVSYEYVDSRSQ